jgi:hypothetical protein
VQALIRYDEEGFVHILDPEGDPTKTFKIAGSAITAEQLRCFSRTLITQVLDHVYEGHVIKKTDRHRGDRSSKKEIYVDDLIQDLVLPFEAKDLS